MDFGTIDDGNQVPSGPFALLAREGEVIQHHTDSAEKTPVLKIGVSPETELAPEELALLVSSDATPVHSPPQITTDGKLIMN